MKVKCKLCGFKGYWDGIKINEFSAPLFLFTSSWNEKERNNFVCRRCLRRILDALAMEQYQIKRLYEPEINKKPSKK